MSSPPAQSNPGRLQVQPACARHGDRRLLCARIAGRGTM